MAPDPHWIVELFQSYAYAPMYAYTAIVVLLIASSFGLPVPEEVTLLSAGLLAHIGSHPELYPPPEPGMVGVSPVIAAIVCFLAVFLSDLIVFTLGRILGPKMFKAPILRRLFTPELVARITAWTTRVGPLACGVFRFTPGLRFPGHFSCGAFGISYTKFILIDGTAALLTVPTQVLLMAHFGEEILGVLKNVKIAAGIALGIALVYFLFKRWHKKRTARLAEAQATSVRNGGKEQQAAS